MNWNRAQAHRNGTADHGLDQRGVAGQAGQHFPGLQGLEELRRLGQYPRVNGTAQVCRCAFTHPRDRVIARRNGQRPEPRQAEQSEEMPVQAHCTEQAGTGLGPVAEAEIDEITKRQRHQQNGCGTQAQQDKGQRESRPVGPQERPQAFQRRQGTRAGWMAMGIRAHAPLSFISKHPDLKGSRGDHHAWLSAVSIRVATSINLSHCNPPTEVSCP